QLCDLYKTQNDWQGHIFQFIDEWIDDKPTIKVRTSGSTGEPKAIELRKDHLRQSARRTQEFFGLRPKDSALLCLPAQYIAGKMMIVRAFVVGYNLMIVPPSSNPFVTLTTPIDFTAITPHQLAESFETLKHKQIRIIIVGGSEIPPALESKLHQLPQNIYATYGMTETGSHVALRKINGIDATDVYEALPGVHFNVDCHNRLIIQADYLTITPLQTNDVVQLIDHKHFRWLGRFDNVINSGGIKIFPENIERKIAPVVPYPFYIGTIPDDKLTEKVCLFIEKSTPLSPSEEQELLQKIRPLVETYQLPRKVICLAKFERTNNGKLIRKNLKR
ncbi:MAG: AMP-binding protein, partial [Bacteroidales bacterium]|nr:AMP-binding protein [Bacteroidales bacterium]